MVPFKFPDIFGYFPRYILPSQDLKVGYTNKREHETFSYLIWVESLSDIDEADLETSQNDSGRVSFIA